MKIETAIKVLREDAKFLGFKKFEDYIAEVKKSPLVFPNKVIEAHKVFNDAAIDAANEFYRIYGD